MEACEPSAAEKTFSALKSRKLPRWAELPDLDLYMDQVLSLTGRYLSPLPGFAGKGLTASMVNNYVKQGVLPAPVKKKYSRSHLARLLMICVLKQVLPIPSIQKVLALSLSSQTEEGFYDRFCSQFEESGIAAASAFSADGAADSDELLIRAALRAQAEQALALQLASFPAP